LYYNADDAQGESALAYDSNQVIYFSPCQFTSSRTCGVMLGRADAIRQGGEALELYEALFDHLVGAGEQRGASSRLEPLDLSLKVLVGARYPRVSDTGHEFPSF